MFYDTLQTFRFLANIYLSLCQLGHFRLSVLNHTGTDEVLFMTVKSDFRNKTDRICLKCDLTRVVWQEQKNSHCSTNRRHLVQIQSDRRLIRTSGSSFSRKVFKFYPFSCRSVNISWSARLLELRRDRRILINVSRIQHMNVLIYKLTRKKGLVQNSCRFVRQSFIVLPKEIEVQFRLIRIMPLLASHRRYLLKQRSSYSDRSWWAHKQDKGDIDAVVVDTFLQVKLYVLVSHNETAPILDALLREIPRIWKGNLTGSHWEVMIAILMEVLRFRSLCLIILDDGCGQSREIFLGCVFFWWGYGVFIDENRWVWQMRQQQDGLH